MVMIMDGKLDPFEGSGGLLHKFTQWYIVSIVQYGIIPLRRKLCISIQLFKEPKICNWLYKDLYVNLVIAPNAPV